MKIILLSFLLAFAMPQFVFAKQSSKNAKSKTQSSKPNSKKDSSAQVLEVKSSLVQKELRKELPKQICSPDSPTIRCHRISRKKCLKMVKEGLASCLKSNKVKKMVNGEESVDYGQKVGLCLKAKIDPQIKMFKKDCVEPAK